jgi:RHS repeat-associated protein
MEYRYAFNGKEIDDSGEWGENTTAYDFGARMYNPLLGRFFSIDPLTNFNVSLSPYQAYENNPTVFIDPDGKDAIVKITQDEQGNTILTITSSIRVGEEITDAQMDALQLNFCEVLNQIELEYTDGEDNFIIRFDLSLARESPLIESGYNTLKLDETLPHSTGLFDKTEIVNYDKEENKADIKISPTNQLLYSGNESLEWEKTVMPHEFLHVIGLADRYWTDVVNQGDSRTEYANGIDEGYENDILGTRTMPSNSNAYRGLVEMAKAAMLNNQATFIIDRENGVMNYDVENMDKASKQYQYDVKD